jgi:hypothetical protein
MENDIMATFKVPGTITRKYDSELTVEADSKEDAIKKAKEMVEGEFEITKSDVREIEIVYRDHSWFDELFLDDFGVFSRPLKSRRLPRKLPRLLLN